MTIQSMDLLRDLKKRTQTIITQVEDEIQHFSIEQLNWKANAESWSILECLEHLNLYGQFYIPAIRKAIDGAKKIDQLPLFKSGILGNYFAKSMLPKEGVVTNKMKTFRDKYPASSQLNKKVIENFLHQQHQFLTLLDAAEQVNLNKTKTPITISNLIKLKLGDTFRFVIYHHQRHMVQIQNLISSSPHS